MQSNQPPACANCRAPLTPGALNCFSCGAPSPYAQGPGPGAGYGSPYGGFPQAAAFPHPPLPQQEQQSLKSSANWALGLTLGALPICCAPVSIVGGVFGVRAVMIAKRTNQPVPVRAIVSIVLAVLSLGGLVSAIVAGQINAHQTAKQLGGVDARLAGKREQATLEVSTACDLVQERLLADGYDGNTFGLENVKCDGAFTGAADRASLNGITFTYSSGSKPYTVNACFEHGQRWFALAIDKNLDCSTVPLPPWPAGTLTDPALSKEEQTERDAVPAMRELIVARDFGDKLSKVRDAITAAPLTEAACTKADFAKYVTGTQAMKVDTVDFDYLNAAPADAGSGDAAQWSWLTSDRVAAILKEVNAGKAKDTPASDRSKDSGPLLVVYRAVEKRWPVMGEKTAFIGKKLVFEEGYFAGWMIVANLDTGALSCRAKMEFSNGDDITYNERGSAKDNARDAVMDDFKSQFEDSATKSIKALTAGQLRLGYLLLE